MPTPYDFRIGEMVYIKGGDYEGRTELIGRVGTISDRSSASLRYEVSVEDDPPDFTPHRAWFEPTDLEHYTPPPTDHEELEHWLTS